ncbi:Eco57I restriction-modification methylase domain-containing protein [Variovorax gossypii]
MELVLPGPSTAAIPSALDAAIEQLHDSTAYFTAEPIVEQLLDMMTWPAGDRRLVDNSCGDGAFLGAALKRLLAREPYVDDVRIAHLVTGWADDYFAVAEARSRLARILAAHGRDEGRAAAIAQKMVVHGDFLLKGPREAAWDVIAGNPPFLRYAHLPSVLRDEYERALPDYSQGDLLHSFIDRCALTLRPGGEIALVSSDRWLFTQSAAKLRAVIGQRLGLHHVSRLDCSSAFYRPKNRRAGQPPRIHPVAFVLRESDHCSTALTRAPIYPEASDEAYAGHRPLAELATIRLAPWLGKHGLFVVDQATARAAGIPSSMLVPAIDTDNIKGGVLSAPTKFAIRTYRDVDPPEQVLRHLDANMHLLAHSKRRKTQRWLPPESFEKLDLSQPSLLIPRIAASLRPVRVPAGVLPVDHGISIVTGGAATLDELEHALLRPQAEAWVRARAPRLENGYFSLCTTLLRALPVNV